MLDIIRRNSQSWGVKLVFAIIILVFVFWGASSMRTPGADVLVQFNGDVIQFSDFIKRYQTDMQRAQNDPLLSQLSEKERGLLVLQGLIRDHLWKLEAERLHLTVSNTEIASAITSVPMFKNSEGRFDQALYENTLSANRLTPGVYERSVGEDLLAAKLQAYIGETMAMSEAELRSTFNFEAERRIIEYVLFAGSDFQKLVSPTDVDLQTYYDANKSKYAEPAKAQVRYTTITVADIAARQTITDDELKAYYESQQGAFTEPGRYHVLDILIAAPFGLDSSDDAVKAASDKAQKVLSELKGGKDFAEAAKAFSDDPVSREQGGDLGWITMGEADPTFEKALQNIKTGEYGGPVRTVQGFHVFKLVGLEPEKVKSFEEAKSDAEARLRESKAYEALAPTRTAVETEVQNGMNLDDLAAAYGVTVTDTGYVNVTELAPKLKVQVSSLENLAAFEIGKIMPVPIDVEDGFLFLQLQQYKAAYTPELAEVREKVLADVSAEQSARLARQEAEAVAAKIGSDGKLPEEYASKVQTSTPASRMDSVPGLGFAPSLNDAIFATPPGKWLPSAYDVNNGSAVVMVKQVLTPSDDDWRKVGALYANAMNQRRMGAMLNTYLAELWRRYDVRVLTDNPLEFGRR